MLAQCCCSEKETAKVILKELVTRIVRPRLNRKFELGLKGTELRLNIRAGYLCIKDRTLRFINRTDAGKATPNPKRSKLNQTCDAICGDNKSSIADPLPNPNNKSVLDCPKHFAGSVTPLTRDPTRRTSNTE